jgi:uncharacterized protein YjiS (DUF1127 family)
MTFLCKVAGLRDDAYAFVSRGAWKKGAEMIFALKREAVAGRLHRSLDRRAANNGDTTPISLWKILHCLRTAYGLGRERYRQRRQLMEMDKRQLKDIGITRDQAEQEARKPIWRE